MLKKCLVILVLLCYLTTDLCQNQTVSSYTSFKETLSPTSFVNNQSNKEPFLKKKFVSINPLFPWEPPVVVPLFDPLSEPSEIKASEEFSLPPRENSFLTVVISALLILFFSFAPVLSLMIPTTNKNQLRKYDPKAALITIPQSPIDYSKLDPKELERLALNGRNNNILSELLKLVHTQDASKTAGYFKILKKIADKKEPGNPVWARLYLKELHGFKMALAFDQEHYPSGDSFKKQFPTKLYWALTLLEKNMPENYRFIKESGLSIKVEHFSRSKSVPESLVHGAFGHIDGEPTIIINDEFLKLESIIKIASTLAHEIKHAQREKKRKNYSFFQYYSDYLSESIFSLNEEHAGWEEQKKFLRTFDSEFIEQENIHYDIHKYGISESAIFLYDLRRMITGFLIFFPLFVFLFLLFIAYTIWRAGKDKAADLITPIKTIEVSI